jgi:uncharacterized repeat protein (TIGR01451 family)
MKVSDMAFADNNQELITTGEAKIWVWNVADGSLVRSTPVALNCGTDFSVAVSPDQQTYAAGNCQTTIYNISDGSIVRTFGTQDPPLAYSPNGQIIATAHRFDGPVGVYLWNVSDGSFIRALANTGDRLSRIDGSSAAFSPDGSMIAVIYENGPGLSATGQISLFRVSDGALLRTLGPFTGWGQSIAFSPDGQSFISTDTNTKVRIWRASDGALLQTYDQETSFQSSGFLLPLWQIAYSPNGQRFAYGRHDATVVVANNPFALGTFSVSMAADHNPAPVGQNFNYNVSVTNTGVGSASGTVLTDVLPSLVTLTSATPSQGSCAFVSATRTLTCSLGTLSTGASATVQITVKPRDEGTLDNTASVSAPNYGTASASVNGLPAQKLVDLSASMSNSADPIFNGQQTSYTTVVKNANTTFNATGVALTDPLPSGMTFVSATTSQGSLVTPPVGSNGTVTANLGSLAPGATATMTVTVKATQSGLLTNTAQASSNEGDSNPANNAASQATTVKAAALQKVLLASQVLTGGCQNTTGNVYLTGPAGPGGLTVPLSSNVSGASVPVSVFIPEGQMVSPGFTVTTSPVNAKQVGLITAGSGQGSVSRGITINVGNGSCP